MAQLDHIISQRVARGSATRWNFHGRTVNSVYEMKEDLIACFSAIMNGSGWDTSSISEASGLKRWLEDSTFLFFLDLFHQIFPHIEFLFSVFQSRRTSISLVADAVRACIEAIQTLRDDIDEISEQYQSDARSFSIERNRAAAKEACDVISVQLARSFLKYLICRSIQVDQPFTLR